MWSLSTSADKSSPHTILTIWKTSIMFSSCLYEIQRTVSIWYAPTTTKMAVSPIKQYYYKADVTIR